jgi:hypothetical protein
VLPGNATNNLWVLDLTLNLLHFTSYNYSYSLHKFTTHKAETCLLLRYHFTTYLSCLSVSPLSVSVLTVFRLYLYLLSSSSICLALSASASACLFLNFPYLCLHLLKTVFRRLSREHLVEPSNFLFSDKTAANVFVTTETPMLRLSFPW